MEDNLCFSKKRVFFIKKLKNRESHGYKIVSICYRINGFLCIYRSLDDPAYIRIVCLCLTREKVAVFLRLFLG